MLTRRSLMATMTIGALAALGQSASARSRNDAAAQKWLVLYAADAALDSLTPFDLFVFDRLAHPDLEPLTDAGKTVFGYISLGEMNKQRDEFARLRDWGILGEENPNWAGSHFIDVRDTRWVALVIEEMVPEILHRGFQGLFLDTLDNPIELERRDPTGNAGMTLAAARLIKALKLHWPEVPIILNRGYGLLDAVAFDIDYVLGESVYADYDFATKSYSKVPDALYREQIDILKRASAKNPNLSILTLDYWDPSDRATISEIYRVQSENGFSPYVATIDLDVIVPPPAE